MKLAMKMSMEEAKMNGIPIDDKIPSSKPKKSQKQTEMDAMCMDTAGF